MRWGEEVGAWEMPFCSLLFNWNVVSKKALEREIGKTGV